MIQDLQGSLGVSVGGAQAGPYQYKKTPFSACFPQPQQADL